MLELTEIVRSKLHGSLAAANDPVREGKCFRVVPKDDKYLTLTIAKPAPDDTVFMHDGDYILALPRALHPFFRDKRLDIDPSGRLNLN